MSGQEKPPLLTSWKEIAAFFGRDVRTVQRWEHDGLPVHRRPGQGRSGVFAERTELEAWLRGRSEAAYPQADTHSESAPAGNPPPDTADAVTDARRGWSRPFAAAVLSLIGATTPLAWMAAARSPAGVELAKPFASSAKRLWYPRWGNLDGHGRADLLINSEETLLFLDAGSRPCPADAVDCADVRIASPAECESHALQVSDLNGDGLDDIAVSCLLREPEGFHRTGPTYLVWGRSAWPPRLELPAAASVVISAPGAHDDRLHTCLVPQAPPDLNGDGISDLLLGSVELGSPERGAEGGLHVMFGRRDWPAAITVADADVTIRGSRRGEGLGGLCATGDVNGDGRQDLGVLAAEDRLWYLLGGAGRAYLIENPGVWPRQIDMASYPAARVEGGVRKTAQQQIRLADLDGDGRSEFVVSEPRRLESPKEPGVTAIWRGGLIRIGTVGMADADVIVEGAAGGSFGSSLDRTDLDGDGVSELLVADPRSGSLLLLPLRQIGGRLTRSDAATLARHEPEGPDGGPVGSLAAGEEQIAQTIRAGGRWHLLLHEPYGRLRLDVRPYNSDDVVLRPGTVAIAIARTRNEAGVLPETLRANGAAPSAHTLEDVDNDGVADLVAYFESDAMRLSMKDQRIIVTGRDAKGRYLRGVSGIRLVFVEAVR